MSEPTFLNNEIRDWLMDCGLFDQLQLADFAAASGYFSISTVAEGEAIFREGDAGSFMCILHTGQVAVQKTGPDGQVITMATLRSGRAFGEMAVLDGERRSATCVAATNCQLLNLGKDSLEKCSTTRRRSPRRSSAPSPSRCRNACAWPTVNWRRNRFNRRGFSLWCRLAQCPAPVDPCSAGWAFQSAPAAGCHCRHPTWEC